MLFFARKGKQSGMEQVSTCLLSHLMRLQIGLSYMFVRLESNDRFVSVAQVEPFYKSNSNKVML